MDPLTIDRVNGLDDAQPTKTRARHPKKPIADPNKRQPMQKANTVIVDGARLVVDADLASDIIDRHAFDGQRPLDIANLRSHTLDMQHGRFWPGSQIVFARLPGGKMILVDGYHRLQAVRESGTVAEFQVRIEPVADIDEVRDLYCSIDTNIRRRTDAEISRAAGIANETGIQQYIVTAALGAVTTIACGLRTLRSHERPAEVVTAYGRKDAVREWTPEIRVYSEILQLAGTKMKSRLMTQGMMAIGLVTLRHQPSKALDFWTAIAENDGLRKGDPRKALVSVLLESNHRGKIDAGLLYASVAWNAWIEGRKLEILRIYTTTRCRPIGTPFGDPVKSKPQHQIWVVNAKS